jgi:hypothetical protein
MADETLYEGSLRLKSIARTGTAFEGWLTASAPSLIEVRNLVLPFLLALFRHGPRGAETYPSGSRTGWCKVRSPAWPNGEWPRSWVRQIPSTRRRPRFFFRVNSISTAQDSAIRWKWPRVRSEGDKTVIRNSQSFNVISLGSKYDRELQSIFCSPFRWRYRNGL